MGDGRKDEKRKRVEMNSSVVSSDKRVGQSQRVNVFFNILYFVFKCVYSSLTAGLLGRVTSLPSSLVSWEESVEPSVLAAELPEHTNQN